MSDWRDKLSNPPVPHSLAEIILLCLDIAEADAADLEEQSGAPQSSHREATEAIGYDPYDLVRKQMEAMVAMVSETEELPE